MEFVFEKIKSLGTDAEIFIAFKNKIFAEEKINWAKKTLEDFENKFSRFKKNSELSEFNNLKSGDFYASPIMIDIFKKCFEFHKITNGIFDPTIAEILENIGYNKSFDLLDRNLNLPDFNLKKIKENFSKKSDLSDLIIDEKKLIIKKPENLKIDFGGIGKGYVVDLIADEFKKYFSDFWISIGGDMFLSGKNNGKNWQIDIQNPFDLAKNAISIEIKNKKAAVATSGISKRNWTINGINFHHIIDSKSGLPAESDVLLATVISNNAASADIFAKSIVIMETKKGLEFINRRNEAECLIIDKGFNFYKSAKWNI
ncbi:FAD:protein FMN transferase [Candidatus Wolfebacteria bacterium]|nr:FAD:protein FMN transferase [Candidatus Wolfebacteria bacterium]